MNRILQGTVFDRLPEIEPRSVDCCVTSPPYWALRSYLPKGHALKHLELGCEKTPAEYVAAMVRVFGLVRETLADHGTVWLNVGDTYTHAPGKRKTTDVIGAKQETNHGSNQTGNAHAPGIEEGNLCLIPQRLAIGLQDSGWIVRSYIVWSKLAPMPQSMTGWSWRQHRIKVKSGSKYKNSSPDRLGEEVNVGFSMDDKSLNAEWVDCPGCKKCLPNGGLVLRKGSWRPTSSYEPILMLAKTPDYFADGEPVKTEAAESTVSRDKYSRVLEDEDEQFAVRHDHETTCDNGANLRDVWRIGAEPLSEKHYAAYPTELVRKCLLAGTSAKGYCASCGKPWVRVLESKSVPHPSPRARGREAIDVNGGNQANGSAAVAPETKTVGWRQSCKCAAGEPRPGLVLDPFCGSGRTAITASRMGLDFIGVELNPDFVSMAERILRADSPLFNGVES